MADEFESKLDNTYESINLGDDDKCDQVNQLTNPILSIHPSLFGIQNKCIDEEFSVDDMGEKAFAKLSQSQVGRPSVATTCTWSSNWTLDDLDDNEQTAHNASQLLSAEIRRLSKGSIIDEQILKRNTLAVGGNDKMASYESLTGLELLSSPNVECLGVYVPISTNPQNSATSSKSSSYVSAKDDLYCGLDEDDIGDASSLLIENMLRSAAVNDDDYYRYYANDKRNIMDDASSLKCFATHNLYKNSNHILPRSKFQRFFHKSGVLRACMSLKNKLLAVVH